MITEKDIQRIATLSKLQIEEEELPLYIKELDDMLLFAQAVDSALDEAELNEAEPVHFCSLRDDEVLPSVESTEILINATDTEDGFFKLRKRA